MLAKKRPHLTKNRPHLVKNRPHLAKKRPCNFVLFLAWQGLSQQGEGTGGAGSSQEARQARRERRGQARGALANSEGGEAAAGYRHASSSRRLGKEAAVFGMQIWHPTTEAAVNELLGAGVQV